MKFIISILSISLLSFVAGLYLPWWAIAIIAFLVSVLIGQKPGRSFLAGFIGIFLLWGVLAYTINSANNGILAGRIGGVLGIGEQPFLLILITGMVGGLVAGLASLAGSYLRKN
ncbi:MAG TPA: hypothetical protein PK191_04390 [Niabella sp.]|nr:hypothetical protein [Niabella sp.]HOZ97826.1 hypothetical protein [Niabella sp.]HQW15665.1 hypothetical protein [Niabella sp.]HQX20818.1 hypothetical protein [Niabella sp.]HQX41403.1 hypothetical protein [Niabella sp.]